MTISLYAATIPSYRQLLGAVAGLLAKAEAHCAAGNCAADDLIGARLAPDMLPLAYQVKSTATHSIGAIEAVRIGVFKPDMTPPPADFAGLAARVAATLTALDALDPAEVDSFVGRDTRFEFGEYRMDFTAEDFLLSFAQPNFYFHATTAYNILRAQGLSIGKIDFMGRPRLKRAA